MTFDDSMLSPQEMGERFDLLATDAKEYAVFLIGLEGNLLCWNTGAERIFGYHSHEIVGQHFPRFFHRKTRSPASPSKSCGRRSRMAGRMAFAASAEGWYTVLAPIGVDAAT